MVKNISARATKLHYLLFFSFLPRILLLDAEKGLPMEIMLVCVKNASIRSIKSTNINDS